MPEFDKARLSASRGGPAPLARVLVAYDGSDSANAAAAFGLWLAGKLGAATTMVHAGPTPESVPSAEALPAATEQVAAYEREWQRLLENLREYASKDAVVSSRVLRGTAAGTLIAAALDTGADLILTGSRGAGRVRGTLLGSVSAQVLTHAPCSVMIFREHEPSTPASHARSVVVGIDGSPSSWRALELAQALAIPLAAQLVLVHAYAQHIPFTGMTTGGADEQLRTHGHAVLDAAEHAVTASVDLQRALVNGHPRDALMAACERHAPALLVVGNRGLGGFQELLLGSTSRHVANHAPCPVLVARHPAPRG